MPTTPRMTLGILLGLLLVSVSCEPAGPTVRLATTTSTQNSGLLDFLLSDFEAMSGIEVQVIAVGTGEALELGRRADVDVVLVHAREREEAFLAEGYASARRDVMWNDFVIVGPAGDPADVRGLRAATALRQIVDRGSLFVSRGDDSGTHIREVSLWASTGSVPSTPNYMAIGQGMGKCLTFADEKQAYVLTDRGTWLAMKARLALDLMVEGGSELHNPYGVLLVDSKETGALHSVEAKALFDYLTSPRGQARIGMFRVEGEPLFHPYQETSDDR